jgi:hypothetical protein
MSRLVCEDYDGRTQTGAFVDITNVDYVYRSPTKKKQTSAFCFPLVPFSVHIYLQYVYIETAGYIKIYISVYIYIHI